MPTKEDLKYFQSMPLDIKVAMTKTRIREWVNHFGESGVYISFSGGKDSTVLLHLVRELYPDIPAVFVNTGLEYPEIQRFVQQFDNTVVLYPRIKFKEVITTYGYPVISKQVARKIGSAQKGERWAMKAVKGELKDRQGNKSRFNVDHYAELMNADFHISAKCCDIMKKDTVHRYEKSTKRIPMTAQMACESSLREANWIAHGCNAFDQIRQISNPMSFWTENDVLQYIYENNIPIAAVYGDVIKNDGQMTFDEDLPCTFCTTGCDRTGCMFCGFGAHLSKVKHFVRLKETHPKQYNFCIGGGFYDSDGLWKPDERGLGLGHVFDVLNELYSKNGKPFIEY